MKTFVPGYYSSFKCIAGKCKHNCCIGWEIEIDSDTYNIYKNVSGCFGEKLRKNTCEEEHRITFAMTANDRCPFLDKNNLCEIILNLGEDKLCDICTLHPRFTNFFETRNEIGIGMACEEATRIILSQTEPFCLECISSPVDETVTSEKEKEFFDKRNIIFKILSDDKHSLSKKINLICAEFSVCYEKILNYDWCDFLLNLECLDEKWQILLSELKYDEQTADSYFENEYWDKIFENIITYYIYRYLHKGIECSLTPYVSLAIFAFVMIKHMCVFHFDKFGNIDFEDAVEYCRMFSAEIEYSEENINDVILELEFL
ncbi:MAG: flagellin lysine-N-methylase [Clostridia bacterium]|nr:flagellin lysine-N-methylase [Clostridia bacterium]